MLVQVKHSYSNAKMRKTTGAKKPSVTLSFLDETTKIVLLDMKVLLPQNAIMKKRGEEFSSFKQKCLLNNSKHKLPITESHFLIDGSNGYDAGVTFGISPDLKRSVIQIMVFGSNGFPIYLSNHIYVKNSVNNKFVNAAKHRSYTDRFPKFAEELGGLKGVENHMKICKSAALEATNSIGLQEGNPDKKETKKQAKAKAKALSLIDTAGELIPYGENDSVVFGDKYSNFPSVFSGLKPDPSKQPKQYVELQKALESKTKKEAFNFDFSSDAGSKLYASDVMTKVIVEKLSLEFANQMAQLPSRSATDKFDSSYMFVNKSIQAIYAKLAKKAA